MDATMNLPNDRIDVHMGRLDMACQDCHRTRRHAIAGRLLSVSNRAEFDVACTDCHSARPHAQERLNAHTDAVSCQACHIPRFAVEAATKMSWDWSQAGQDITPEDPHLYDKKKGRFTYASEVVPEYRWYDGAVEHYLPGQHDLAGRDHERHGRSRSHRRDVRCETRHAEADRDRGVGRGPVEELQIRAGARAERPSAPFSAEDPLELRGAPRAVERQVDRIAEDRVDGGPERQTRPVVTEKTTRADARGGMPKASKIVDAEPGSPRASRRRTGLGRAFRRRRRSRPCPSFDDEEPGVCALASGVVRRQEDPGLSRADSLSALDEVPANP